MTNNKFRGAFCLALGLVAGFCLHASPIATYASADYQLGGSGSKTLVLVVDWNDGKADDSISFGIITDAATIGDALLEVDMASPQFDVDLIRYSFGAFGERYAFDAERVTELDPVTDTPFAGSNGEYTHDFSTGYTDPGDHLGQNTPAPIYSPYFSTWTGTQGLDNWAYNGGLGDATTDGGAYGFAYNDGSLGPDAIPEPATIILFLAGLGYLTWSRRASSKS